VPPCPAAATGEDEAALEEADAPTESAPLEEGEAETGPVDESAIRHDGIAGLIVDDTVTFIGRQFYDTFAIAWLDQGMGDDYNLSIHEQPTAISGSRVWVEHNRTKLFEVFLPPTRANIEATATAAAGIVAQRFKAMALERALFADPDLAPDEL
jgi:curli production assembly/transport component CsgE